MVHEARAEPRVAVLRGGPSGEREVSLVSGESVLAGLERAGIRAFDALLEVDGSVRLSGGEPLPLGAALERLRQECDVVFLALHGTFGEDGTVQGLLDSFGLAYTGSGVAASALAMDKGWSRRVAQTLGLCTARAVEGGPSRDPLALEALDAAARTLELPVFVKPSRSGSSVGVTRVERQEDLRAALVRALDEDDHVVVEEGVAGIEVSCPVLGDAGAGARALPVVEIVPKAKFFDYRSKYTAGESQEICPARLPAATLASLQDAALRVHEAFSCRSVSRSDFIVPEDGAPVFLELNTLPGMTPLSLVPLAARAAGLSYPELCATLVRTAAPPRGVFRATR